MGDLSDGRCIGCRHPSGSTCGGCGTFVNDGWDGRSPADLTTRLLAALDAEQQIAEAATPGEWKESDHNHYLVVGAMPVSGSSLVTDAKHIAYQDPARTLRRIAALRRIVERHRAERWHFSTHDVEMCRCGDERYPCSDVLDIAAALGVEP